MTDEAVIIELLGNQGDVIRYAVANGTGILKGTLMYLSGDRTVSASSADGQIFKGIAASEKVADDGQTSLGLYTNCIADLKDSGSGMSLGDRAKLNGANVIATADEAGAMAAQEDVGEVLEAASSSEVVAVRVLK